MQAGVLFADIFNIGEAEQFIDVNERLAAAKYNLAESERKLGLINQEAQPLAVSNYEKEIAGFSKQITNLQDELNRLDEILKARQTQKDALKDLLNAPTKPSSNTKEIDELSKIVSAYEQLAGKLDPIIAAANEYAAAQATVNAAVAAGAITQDQANVTLEMAKQKFELATGSAVDLSSVYSTLASSMESSMMAMVDGTMSAKDAFRSMASAVIKELFRVLVVQQLVNAAMGVFGYAPTTGGGFAPKPARAAGGPVQAGVPTIAGEHGRELFVPQSNGRIMTVAQTKQMQGGGGGGVVVNQTINVTTGVQQTVRAEIKSLMPQIADNAKAAVLDAKRRGGSYGGGFA